MRAGNINNKSLFRGPEVAPLIIILIRITHWRRRRMKRYEISVSWESASPTARKYSPSIYNYDALMIRVDALVTRVSFVHIQLPRWHTQITVLPCETGFLAHIGTMAKKCTDAHSHTFSRVCRLWDDVFWLTMYTEKTRPRRKKPRPWEMAFLTCRQRFTAGCSRNWLTDVGRTVPCFHNQRHATLKDIFVKKHHS